MTIRSWKPLISLTYLKSLYLLILNLNKVNDQIFEICYLNAIFIIFDFSYCVSASNMKLYTR